VTEGELLNIDGKTLGGAKEAGNSRSLIQMVSVWSASQHLVLGQQKVSEKSNEITAIPALLKLLSVRGCLVSIADAIALRFPQRALHQADAMGCQTEIAKVIIEQGADYVLALKGNQGDLYTDVVQLFTAARKQNFRNIDHQFHSTVSKGHGRIETRRYWTMGNTEYLIGAHK
jgi:predicted transposase YbfD/YdcC